MTQDKDEVFERGIINVFRWLSQDYKTRSPCKSGSKIIVNNLVRWDQWGFYLNSGPQADRLADQERILHLFSGKPNPNTGNNIALRLDTTFSPFRVKEYYEDEMSRIIL